MRWLLVIIAVGLTVRLAFLSLRSSDLSTDPDAYLSLSDGILSTGGLCQPNSNVPTAFRPPVFPYALALLRWLGATSSVAVVIVNLSATVFTILATCWIARRCGLSAKWCRLAAAIPALDPLLIRYTAMPMTEVLSTALLTAAILCAIGTLPLPGSVGRRLRSAALAGVFFGLAGLCRPIAFVACAGVSLLVAFRLLLLDRATLLASEQELSSVRGAAENTLNILEQNKRMQTVVDQLREEKAELSASNAELSDSTRIDWFVRGGAVSLVAFVIGILVTRIRWRKQDSWGSY